MELTHICSGLRTFIARAGALENPFPYVAGTNTFQTLGPPKSLEATMSARSEFQPTTAAQGAPHSHVPSRKLAWEHS